MDKKLVKDLIDKILIEDISDAEMKLILQEIDDDDELQTHYQEVIKLKDNLQSIAEENAFAEKDLIASRNELFNHIDHSSREFTLFQLVASIAATFIITISFFLFTNNTSNNQFDMKAQETGFFPEGEILSLDFDNLNKDQVIFTGRSINNFEIEGSIKDDMIQDIIKKTASSDLNISHRLRALQLLEYSNESNDLLLDLIKNEDDNTLVRKEALRRLAELTKGANLLATYVNLLKEENNILLQQQLIEIIKSHQEKNQSYEEIEKMIKSKSSKELRLKS